MTDFEDIRARYDAIVPDLELVCRQLIHWLTAATEDLGILDPRIEGRVKQPHSLIKKALRRELDGEAWDDLLVEASDKIGVRADLVYLADVPRLTERICAAEDFFEIPIKMDDKRETTLGIDKLGYHGVHFDVVPRELPAALPREMARCEIQVRTNAQAAWAMATHDLIYKAPVEPGDRLRRRVNRLTALLECFDEDVDRTRGEMMGRDGYPVAIVLGALEAARMRFPVVSYDRELARDVLTALLGDVDAEDAHALAGEIAEFVDEYEDKLRGLLSSATTGHFMLGQPETIYIFLELQKRRMDFQRRWISSDLPYRILDELAAEWGATLATPL